MRKVETLAIIEDGDRTLLAMKKCGFGEGWWNGYGGKVEEGETIEDAMTRELKEESGLIAKKFGKRAMLEFFFEGTDKVHEIHVFEVTDYEGELIETDEMAPKWFDKSEIPFGQMWPADEDWMSMYFEGKNIVGNATFDGETKAFIKSDFRIKEDNDWD